MSDINVSRIILFLILFISSCTSENDIVLPDANDKAENDTVLLGEWKLIERLFDPGDGSAEFMTIPGQESIKFYADQTFESSKKLCVMIPSSHDQGSGFYDPERKTITPKACDNETELRYELKEGSLIIYYLCFEACAEKYLKVSDSSD